jgi:hypothetical protein
VGWRSCTAGERKLLDKLLLARALQHDAPGVLLQLACDSNYTVQPQPVPGSCHYRTAANGQTLPDPNCTPGAISPKVNQDTLVMTICRTGYTKSIRPPASITESEKRENAAAYGYAGSLKDVEYDHLVPLEVGGDPNDPRNLSLSARAECHWLRRSRPLPPIGLRRLTQSVEVASR